MGLKKNHTWGSTMWTTLFQGRIQKLQTTGPQEEKKVEL